MPGVRTVCREQWSRAHLVEGKPTISPPRFLFGADLAQVAKLERSVYRDAIYAGRFLSSEDIGKRQTVISREIANEHHKQLGDTLRVDGFDLEIVGLYETNSMFLDLAIIVGGDVARQIAPQDKSIISSAYIEPDGTIPKDELVAQHPRAVPRPRGERSARCAGDGQCDRRLCGIDRRRTDDAQTSEVFGDFGSLYRCHQPGRRSGSPCRGGMGPARAGVSASDLDLFLFLINIIGVAIALLSILNTMLMSVSERLVEFGVLRANGWTRANVMHLILAESAVLGVAGGVSGCLVGLARHSRGELGGFPARVHLYASPSLLLISLAFSTALGMVGGLYPAWWAVRRSPMEAIRRG